MVWHISPDERFHMIILWKVHSTKIKREHRILKSLDYAPPIIIQEIVITIDHPIHMHDLKRQVFFLREE